MGEYSIQEAIKGFLIHSKLKNGIRAIQIEEEWLNLMGVTISKYTNKIEIINQTLFIHTNVGALKNELQFQKQLIIEKLNEKFNEKIITDVVIK